MQNYNGCQIPADIDVHSQLGEATANMLLKESVCNLKNQIEIESNRGADLSFIKNLQQQLAVCQYQLDDIESGYEKTIKKNEQWIENANKSIEELSLDYEKNKEQIKELEYWLMISKRDILWCRNGGMYKTIEKIDNGRVRYKV